MVAEKKKKEPVYRPVQAGDLYQKRSHVQTLGLGLSTLPRFMKVYFIGHDNHGRMTYNFPKFILVLRTSFFSSWEELAEMPGDMEYKCMEPETQTKFMISADELKRYYTFSTEAK